MALSSTGEVFLWGGAAGKRLERAQREQPSGIGNASSCCAESSGSAAAGSGAQKSCIPWLVGVQAVHITCGVDTAAAVSNTGELLMWGNKQCLPASMVSRAHTLSANDTLAVKTNTVSSAAAGPAAGAASGLCQDQEAAGAITVQLLVRPTGAVQLVLASKTQPSTAGAVTASSAFAGVQQPLQPCRAQAASVAAQQGHSVRLDCSRGPAEFDPQAEAVAGMACGASHHVVLCKPSQHAPSTGKPAHTILLPCKQLPCICALSCGTLALLRTYMHTHLLHSVLQWS